MQTQDAIGLLNLPTPGRGCSFGVPKGCRFRLLFSRCSSAAKVSNVSKQPLHEEQIDANRLARCCISLSRSKAIHETLILSVLHIGHTTTLEHPVDLHFWLHSAHLYYEGR